MPKQPISKKEEAATTPNLPPAGHERNEILKKNEDALLAEEEKIKSQTEVAAFSPDTLKEDRTIQHQLDANQAANAQHTPINDPFDYLGITNKRPDLHYTWVPTSTNPGADWHVHSFKMRGWSLITANDPESPHLKAVDGTRRLGDTILMACPISIYEREQAILQGAAALQDRVTAQQNQQLREKVAQAAHKDMDLHVPGMTDDVYERAMAHAQQRAQQRLRSNP